MEPALPNTGNDADTRINVVMLGRADRSDLLVRRAITRTWINTKIYRAPDIRSAFRMLTVESPFGPSVPPDLLILKVKEMADVHEPAVRAIRRYRLFRDVPLAVLVGQEMNAVLKCLCDPGPNLVLTHEKLESQLMHIVDAAIEFWLNSWCDHCKDRYFCRAADTCVIAGTGGCRDR